MAGRPLAGSRIRARRTDLGLRQADLARTCGISPSYLNLIEHNRRRIGGKLLVDIARALSVDPAQLSEGAASGLVDGLRAAAAAFPGTVEDADRAEDLAGRFPGWAALIAAQADRVAALERTVETLADRLTHDPYLSASLHDVLSVVTAIRSTSAILADGADIPPDWQTRFHRNLYEDSQRLAERSRALVGYLDAGGDASRGIGAPEDELDAFLTARGFHVAELERPDPVPVADIVARSDLLATATGRAMATRFLERYREDAARVPLDPLAALVAGAGPDPSAVAARFGVGLAMAFRRLACLPPEAAGRRIGLIMCDGSGTLTLRKPVDGFPVPRFGAACPLWPLYRALAQPTAALREVVSLPGEPERRFRAYAVCQPVRPADFDAPAVLEAAMLIVPLDGGEGGDAGPARPLGTGCRICPRDGCAARREPSVLAARTGETGEIHGF